MSIVLPVALVAGGYFGWNVWQDKQLEKSAAGGEQYQALIKALETPPGQEITEEQRTTADVLATKILQDFSGSLYADQANLVLARLAVDEKDLSTAEGYLLRVVNEGSNRAMQDLAKVRLARVKIASNDLSGAHALVKDAGESKYASQFAEVRGDVLAAQGNIEEAKAAFQEAIDSLSPQEFQRRSILQIKSDGAELLAGELPESVAVENTVDSAVESAVEDTAETAVESAEETSDADHEAQAVEETTENADADASSENS